MGLTFGPSLPFIALKQEDCMDMDRAITLIGTASDDPVMIAFLKQAGVKKMPSWRSAATSLTKLDRGAVILQFSADVPKGKEDCEPGTIFLEDITFSNPATEKGIGPLTEAIPLGLHIEMDSAQIKQLLGVPSYEGEFLGGLFLTYRQVRPETDLTVKLDKTGGTIQFIRFMPARTE